MNRIKKTIGSSHTVRWSEPPPSDHWLACVSVEDVERLIGEVERLQAVVVAVARERDEGLVLLAHETGSISYRTAAEWLGCSGMEVLHRERESAERGWALVRGKGGCKRL